MMTLRTISFCYYLSFYAQALNTEQVAAWLVLLAALCSTFSFFKLFGLHGSISLFVNVI
jgi:hypothetical protein